jgi:Fe-S cluster assembly protein SufD
MTQVADRLAGTEFYLQAFDHARDTRADEPAWLRDVRTRAMARFGALGFPTTHEEDWRFTSVAPIVERRFQVAADGASGVSADQLAPHVLADVAARLVFVNGRFAPVLSSMGTGDGGVQAGGLAVALRSASPPVEGRLARLAEFESRAFVALNTASFEDGALVVVPDGVTVERPVELVFVSVPGAAPTVSHPRALVLAGRSSRLQLVERYLGWGDGWTFTNAVTEIVAEPDAVVDHYKVQQETMRAYHVATMHVQMGRDANVSSHSLAFGGALTRNDVVAVLGGEGGECTLNGLYLADGRRLVDNHTTIDHAMPHCDSHEVYKGILSGHAQGVFNGKIVVRPDAQKTDAKQTNRALLLSDDAQINTKPQLEIFADDVKCTHGAAIGQLDEDAIFYLRSRGLGLDEARAMLIQAFAGDILGRIRVEPLRARLEAEMLRRLPVGIVA